jgi:CubicO group peptidase (beta-lactamase class C family)
MRWKPFTRRRGSLLVATLAIATGSVTAAAAADVNWAARHGLTSSQYQAEFTRFANLGYRPVDVSGYEVGGQPRFAAIWEQTSGPAWVARHNLNSSQYQAEFTRLANLGYRPVRVGGYSIGGQDYYAAIWHRTTSPDWAARHGLTSAQYQAEFNRFASQGFRPVDVSGYEVGGQSRFAAIWAKTGGPAWTARHDLNSAQYQAAFNDLTRQGYRLVRVSGYSVQGQSRYAAIWEQSGGAPWQARHDLENAGYQTTFEEMRLQGYRPVQVSGFGRGGRDYYAAVWENRNFTGRELTEIETTVSDFMSRFSVPGVSLAIAKDGRLVYARGFGLANKETGEAVTSRHLFRIASVAKPITAVAVMRLVELGRLRLTDRVFGEGNLLGTTYGETPYQANLDRITVQQLLEHTGGGWPNDNEDPMFTNQGMDANALISWMVTNRRLNTVPGTAYAYSNFGYCVLGRIIERVTGEPYEQWVRRAVLGPCGVQGMALAGNTAADRRPNEVAYYGQGSENPYGMNVTRMDAHGGWIANAIDLVRFGVRVDGFATKPDLLTSASVQTMTTASSRNAGYAKGWNVNSANNWWHAGSLPGTQTILVRTSGGFCWALLANTRSLSSEFGGSLDDLMWKVVGKVGTWPSYDLF